MTQPAEQAPARSPASAAAVKAAATRRAKAGAADAPPKRWAREFDACIECGQTDKEHVGKGICIRCRDKHRTTSRHGQAPVRGGTAKLSPQKQRNVKSLLVLTIAGGDAAAARLAPKYWTAEDRLQQDETAALTKAIYAELEAQPKVIEWLARIAEQGVHGQLAYTVAMVALPRLVRRGLVPADVAMALYFAGASAAASGAPAGPAPADVESGPAPVDHRDNGYGQVNVGEFASAGAPIRPGPQEQA